MRLGGTTPASALGETTPSSANLHEEQKDQGIKDEKFKKTDGGSRQQKQA